METSKTTCNRLNESVNEVNLLLMDSINYLKKLVPFKSYSEEEKEIADYIELTISKLLEIYPNNDIVNISKKRIGNSYLVDLDLAKEKTLMLVGHIDVVNEGNIDKWDSSPFELNFVYGEGKTYEEQFMNGKLVGRGTTDMKAFDALMLSILKKVLMEGCKYNIKFLFYDKEEIANSGIEEMYHKGKLQEIVEDVDFTIVGEPTNAKIDNEVSTFFGGTIKINGKGGHSSQINIEDTVYLQLNSLIERVKNMQEKYKNELVLNFTRITADNGSNNTIPSELEIGLNLRSPISISSKQLKEEILEEILDNLDFEETVFDEGGGCEKSIVSKYLGDIPTNSAKYWSDIAILNKITPAVNWGPGTIKQAHNYNETLLIKELRDYISNLDKLLF